MAEVKTGLIEKGERSAIVPPAPGVPAETLQPAAPTPPRMLPDAPAETRQARQESAVPRDGRWDQTLTSTGGR